ncbi:MAG TPA: hypothetical protein VE869_06835 [Gemmatimonas sp.]|nr:hypothetical protein [Gemmatimonas sp.]
MNDVHCNSRPPAGVPAGSSLSAQRPLRHRRRALVTAVALLGALPACRGVVNAYAGDPVTARAHADALASALEQRFTKVTRTPKFTNARLRLGRYALAPSKLVHDSALWTTSRTVRTGPERELELAAGMNGANFAFVARPRVALPTRVGDQRHLIKLTGLGGDDWQWTTEVDHAIGALAPARMDDIARALFASAERAPGVLRTDYRTTFPRTTAALGRMFTLDSINTTPQPDGSTLVAMHVLTSSTGLQARFPAFAKYVDKYVTPTRFRFRLTDRSGAEWFDAQAARGGRMVVRFRTHDGALQPITGAARRMPDSLALTIDALAKFKVFSVGVTSMQGDFIHISTATERAWAMRFTKNPKWHLPLIAEQLLRSPLERPFAGRGIVFRLYARKGPDGGTLLGRDFDVAVRESAIMRFLGNLGFTAMSDYAGTVEDEENRFIAETFQAMRADLRAQ